MVTVIVKTIATAVIIYCLFAIGWILWMLWKGGK